MTAELRDWYVRRIGKNKFYNGRVFNDIKGRFRDGTGIYTSNVTDETMISTGIIVYTLNSIYFCPFEHERKDVETKRKTHSY